MNTIEEKMKVESLHNQALIGLDEHYEDIERISQHGILSKRDLDVVQMVLYFTLGLIKKRRAEAEEI